MADQKVGKIKNYFDRIGVAVVSVLAPIKVGDKIKIVGHGDDFEMEIGSIQIEHENIQEAKKGDDIGMKVDQPVKKGDEILKAE